MERYIGHWDGYTDPGVAQPNNYYLQSEDSGLFRMIPWGTDQTWDRTRPSAGRAERRAVRALPRRRELRRCLPRGRRQAARRDRGPRPRLPGDRAGVDAGALGGPRTGAGTGRALACRNRRNRRGDRGLHRTPGGGGAGSPSDEPRPKTAAWRGWKPQTGRTRAAAGPGGSRRAPNLARSRLWASAARVSSRRSPAGSSPAVPGRSASWAGRRAGRARVACQAGAEASGATGVALR